MRNAIWLLALFCMAVAGALFAGNNESTITIFWPPYRVDLSLNLVILGLLVLFFVLHLALRALAALFAMPGEARRWRLQHKERAMHVALLDSLSNLLAGRFIRARRAAEQVLVQEKFLSRGGEKLPYAPRLRAISHLLVGESAHALQDKVVRDEHYLLAMEQVGMRDAQEARDGVQLRSAHCALHDHNATSVWMSCLWARPDVRWRCVCACGQPGWLGELAWRSRQRGCWPNMGPSRLPPRRAYCGAWRWN